MPFTRANAEPKYGNLLTLPVGKGLLYVQPLYTQRNSGQGRYPALRYVLVSFGENVGIGTTLQGALDDVLGTSSSGASVPRRHRRGGGEKIPSDVRSLLRQAEQKFVEARKALQAGDLNAYAQAQQEAQRLVREALKAAGPAPSASPLPLPRPPRPRRRRPPRRPRAEVHQHAHHAASDAGTYVLGAACSKFWM